MTKLSLAAQVANSIEEKVEEGYWTDILPGSRTIADVLNVSRNTAISAISLLEARGVVLPVTQKGVPRRIDTKAELRKSAPKMRNLLVLHHQRYQMDQNDEAILHDVRKMWHQKEGEVFLREVDFQRYDSCETKLQEIVYRFSADAVVLINPTRAWAKHAHDNLPTFLLGGDVPRNWECNLVAYSIHETFIKILTKLKKVGHERVLIPSDSLGRGFHASAAQAYKEVYGEKLGRLAVEDYCPKFLEPLADCWQGYWDTSFVKTKPTAVVLSDPKYACSLYSYCLHNGIKIPQDLVIVVLGDSDLLEWFYPAPIILHFPVDEALSHFKKWLDGDLKLIGYKILRLKE